MDSSRYTLGPLPWDEDHLVRAHFKSFIETQAAIQEHPGFKPHQNLLSMQLALDIFLDAVLDLRANIQAFVNAGGSDALWALRNRYHAEPRVVSVNRSVFSAATAAAALVEHSRRLSKKSEVPGYEKRIDKMFKNSPRHHFVVDLRNAIVHWSMLKSSWRVRFFAGEEGPPETTFRLAQKDLLRKNNWDPLAREFIKENREGVDVRALFEDYEASVVGFHAWFHDAFRVANEPNISEYRRYEDFLNAVQFRSGLRLLLMQILRDRDPYQYLNRYLTPEEMAEIERLPHGSREQVDRIIELADHFDACDEELRAIVYEKFGVTSS